VSYYFTSQFLSTLKAGWAGASVQLYLFPQAPALISGEGENLPTTTAYAGINKVDTLKNMLGWGSTYVVGPSLPVTITKAAGTTRNVAEIAVSSRFVIPPGTPTTPVAAVGFALDKGSSSLDDLMFVTDSTFLGNPLMHANDGVVPAVDATLSNKRVLFYWDDVSAGADAGTMPNAVEGTLLIERTPIPFETARTQHVWIYPQRLNLIANPSFELTTNFWRTNGSIALVGDPPPGAGNNCGRVTGGTPLILESNVFPLTYRRRREPGLTIQMQVRGAGVLKLGLITWDDDYRVSMANWGYETLRDGETTPSWLIGAGFTHIRTMRDPGEAVSGMLRLEYEPYDATLTTGVFDIDQVCVEPGNLPDNGNDWPYFDGDTTYGAREDFSWYGGTSNRHASYSCWYNLRNSTFGRLFAWKVDASSPLTDDEAALQGLAYQWVPAGIPVHGHLDVLYPEDPMWNESRPLVPWSPTPTVLPYLTAAAPSTQNVISPWP
jgi:hypothetical protein